MWWNGGLERDDHGGGASAIPTHGTSANPGGQPRRLDTQSEDAAPPRCAPVCKATCCVFCAFCAVR